MDIITIGFIRIAAMHYDIIKDDLISIKKGQDIKEVEKNISEAVFHHCRVSE